MAHRGFRRRALVVVVLAAGVLAAGLTGALADDRLRSAGALDRFLAVPGAADLQAIADVMDEINADAAAADLARHDFMTDPRGFFAARDVDLGADRFAILAIDMVEGRRLEVIAISEPETAGLTAASVGVGGVLRGVGMAILPAFEVPLEINALDSFFTIITDLGSEVVDRIPGVVIDTENMDTNDEFRLKWTTDDVNRDVLYIPFNFDDAPEITQLITFDLQEVPEGAQVFTLQRPVQGLQALIEATFVIGEFFGVALMLAI